MRLPNTNHENVESIYQFFNSGDESLLPENLSHRDVQIAVKRAEKEEYENLPGFVRVVNALLKEELIDNESYVFEYVKNLQGGRSQKLRFVYGGQTKHDEILEKLKLKKVYRFSFGDNEEN